MNPLLILSLFPGADLMGRPWEERGHSVVRGPDLLQGQDMADWKIPPVGRFDGIIGGPPCTEFSRAREIGGKPSMYGDHIGRFWEIVRRARPGFAVMENVAEKRVLNHPAIPGDARPVILKDWNCGGLTCRRRVFFVWPGELADAIPVPASRPGEPELSLLASSWKTGGARRRRGMRAKVSAREAGRIQGYPEIAERLIKAGDKSRLFPERLIVHMLGNGVPKAMADHVARHLLAALQGVRSDTLKGVAA